MSDVIEGVTHHTTCKLQQDFKNAFRLFPTALLAFTMCFNSKNTGKSASLSFLLRKFLIRPYRRPWKVLVHHLASGYLITWNNGVTRVRTFLLRHSWLWPLPKVSVILLPYKGKLALLFLYIKHSLRAAEEMTVLHSWSGFCSYWVLFSVNTFQIILIRAERVAQNNAITEVHCLCMACSTSSLMRFLFYF